jgi:hypothetical protein
LAIIFFGFSFLLFSDLINNLSPWTFYWINQGFDEVYKFVFEGQSTGFFDAIFMIGDFSFLNDTSIIFGYGYRSLGLLTDIGYIDDLFINGIVFLSIIYFAYLSLFKFIPKRLLIVVFTMFLISNFKGSLFNFNDVFSLLILLSFSYVKF